MKRARFNLIVSVVFLVVISCLYLYSRTPFLSGFPGFLPHQSTESPAVTALSAQLQNSLNMNTKVNNYLVQPFPFSTGGFILSVSALAVLMSAKEYMRKRKAHRRFVMRVNYNHHFDRPECYDEGDPTDMIYQE